MAEAGQYTKEFRVDSKDKDIIKALFKEGRMPIAQISKLTQVRRDSVAYRLKRLRNQGVLQSVKPEIKPSAIGYPLTNLVLLKTKIGTNEEEALFIKKLKSNKFIANIATLVGKWDYYLIVLSKDPEQFNQVLKEIRNYIPDYVKEFDVSTIINEPKSDIIDLIGDL